MTLMNCTYVSPYYYSIETMYLVPFLRYSASKNGVTLKPGVRVVQGHCKYSSILYHILDLEVWVISHRRSFKLVPFESLGAVSYSPSIVTMAVS